MPLYGRPISSSSSDSLAAIVVGQQRSNLAKALLKVLQESNYGNRHRQFCSHPPRSEIPLGMRSCAELPGVAKRKYVCSRVSCFARQLTWFFSARGCETALIGKRRATTLTGVSSVPNGSECVNDIRV